MTRAGLVAQAGRGGRRAPLAVAVLTLFAGLAFQYPAPLAAEPQAAREALVTNQTGDTLSIVDLAKEAAAPEIQIGGKPAGIALSPDGSTAYLTAPESKELIVVDVAARRVTARVPVGQGPLGVAVDPSGSTVYVADWYEHKLYAVDAVSNAIVGSVEVGQSPSGVAVTPDGKTIVTADRDSNRISVIDAGGLKLRASVSVGERPFGVTVDAAGTRAYTANVASDDVSVVDLAAGKVVGAVKVGRRPYAVALAAGKGFVSDQYSASVTVFDLTTLAVLKTIDVGDYPEGIDADPSGKAVYVACWDANRLDRIDTATLEVTAQIAVGQGPRAFGRFLRQ